MIEKIIISTLIEAGLETSKLVMPSINKEHFVSRERELIELIDSKVKANQAFDAKILAEEMKGEDSEGYLNSLKAKAGKKSLLESYIRKLADRRAKERIARLCASQDTDAFTSINQITEQRILAQVEKTNFVELKYAAVDVCEVAEKNKGVDFAFSFGPLNVLAAGINRGEVMLIAGYTSQGKCLEKGTKIVMYSGRLKNIEDIKVDDLVMGVDSKPRTVLSSYFGYDDMWTIKQSYGKDYTVNSRHILTLKKSDYAKRAKRYFRKNGNYQRPNGLYPSYKDIINIPIKEYMHKSNIFKKHFQGYRVGVDFSYKIIDIDPYWLGLWLGDGNSRDQRITTVDNEIIDYIKQYANKLKMLVGPSRRYGTRTQTYLIKRQNAKQKNKLLEWLRNYNLIGNKHIPDDYLYNTKKIRLQLLAGLIDTDGYTNYNGYIITQKNKKLSYQIYYLVSSLGMRCSIKETTKTIKSIDFKGKYYKIEIWGDTWKIPIKIKRKGVKRSKKRNPSTTGIKVEYKGKGEYYGFALDGDGLFLLEDFTVLHNTALALKLADSFACNKYKVLYCSSEMPVKDIVIRLFCRRCRINSEKFRTGTLNENDIEAIASETLDMNIPLYLASVSTANEVRMIAERVKPDIIFVDHLHQLMGEGKEYEIVTAAMLSLKDLARKKNVAMILAAQLHRSEFVSKKGLPPKPRKSDLRASGKIEENSQIISFLYWPYGFTLDSEKYDKNKSQLIVAKNTSGPLGYSKVFFRPENYEFLRWR